MKKLELNMNILFTKAFLGASLSDFIFQKHSNEKTQKRDLKLNWQPLH